MIDTSYIIPPVSRALLKKELTKEHFLRKTNVGDKEIYVTTAHLSPNIMKEIGRLRELSFVLSGGGTGNPCDIDEYDTLPEPYCFRQLFVWSPADEEIVGGYRFLHCSNVLKNEDGTLATPTASLFYYTDEFIENYLPYTIELGRAFVQPKYQPSSGNRGGLFSLDNLWDGLGSLAIEVPETRYFFGKVTMYKQMNPKARDLILFFYQKHFPDRDGLISPLDEVSIQSDYNELVKLFNGRNYKEDFQILVRSCKELGTSVPPMISAYMNLSSSMRSFGTAHDAIFGETDETGILVNIQDILPEKKSRYIESYSIKNIRLNRGHLFKVNIRNLPWFKNKDSNPELKKELQELRRIKKARRQAFETERREIQERRRELRRQRRKERREARKNENNI